MANIPKKVQERIKAALRRFQPIISSAKARDVNESDTVTIIIDTLSEVFGYDKYSEITSEYAIRGTYCDLAIKIEGKLRLLIEVKAIGLELKSKYLKQAIDYASNEGVEWVALTNGQSWKVYRVIFEKPINYELVMDIDVLQINTNKQSETDALFLLTREGISKSALDEFYIQKQATGRHTIGAILLCDPVLNVIRRELKRASPDIKIELDEIRETLVEQIIKREVLEGDKSEKAQQKIKKSQKRQLRARTTDKKEEPVSPPLESESPPPTPEASGGSQS